MQFWNDAKPATSLRPSELLDPAGEAPAAARAPEQRPDPPATGRTLAPIGEPSTSARLFRAVAALLVLGALLRLTGLSVHSLWFDEGGTVHVAQAQDLAAALRQDRHPPLSFLAFRGWIRAFGESDGTLRLLPALISSLALVAFARLALLWQPPRAALVSIALFAVAPFHVWHAQEVRMYAFVELAAVLAALGAALAARRSPWGLVLAVVGTAGAVGSHYMGALAGVSVIAIALVARLARRIDTRWALMLAAAPLVAFAAWTPWLVLMLPAQLEAPWRFITPISARETLELPLRQVLVEMDVLPAALVPLGYLLGATLIVGLASFVVSLVRAPSYSKLASMALFAVPVVCAIAAVLVGPPSFQPKYLMAASPGVALMIGAGLAALRPPKLAFGACAFALLGSLGVTLMHRAENHREDYRSACAELASSWQLGDRAVVLSGEFEAHSQATPRHYLRARPDILASLLDSELVLADPRAAVPEGSRLHVIYRDAGNAPELLDELAVELEPSSAGAKRFGIQHLVFRR